MNAARPIEETAGHVMEQTAIRGEAHTVARAQGDPQAAVLLELSYRILPTGEAVASIGGELDVATAETAVGYVRQVIDAHGGPVIVDLASLRFCDAGGLSALLRIANHAEQAGCPFRLASPGRRLVKLMSITGLDRRLLVSSDQRRPEPVTGRIRLVQPASGQRTSQRIVLPPASSEVPADHAPHGHCAVCHREFRPHPVIDVGPGTSH